MRPKIICHMVASIDGRLLVERWTPPVPGVDFDSLLALYEQVAERLDGEGWIVGRKTMQHYAKGTPHGTADRRYERTSHIAERKERSLAVAVDPQGKLHYGHDHINGDHVVAILGENVDDVYLAELQADGVSYLFAGADGHDLPRAMNVLGSEFGVKTLLLEGGGIINGAFLTAGLIDEISLLVYPGIDGAASAPSIFEYIGADDAPAAGRVLRHFHTQTLDGGMVWLRYGVESRNLH